VFYGAEFLAGLRNGHFALYFEWERRMPFYGSAYIVYYSVFLLPFLLPFVLDDAQEIRRWGAMMATTIMIAGIVFVLFPAELGYPAKPQSGWDFLEKLTLVIAGQYNLVPSLHVALTITTASAMWRRLSWMGKWWLTVWVVALVCSTLTTHQHHILDVATGLILAVAVWTRYSTR
jgi:membrane-associated phospholipid phosphatase